MFESELAGDGRLGGLIDCAIPANWPPEDWEPHVLQFCLAQFARYPEQIGWHRYVALREEDGARTLIGCVGGFLKPELEACEIGYSIRPPFERRGFATEAARALIEYLRCDESVRAVVAHTFPRLPGSIRVMEKCGMRFDGAGTEEGTVRYRMELRE